jgi:hypothetical protein
VTKEQIHLKQAMTEFNSQHQQVQALKHMRDSQKMSLDTVSSKIEEESQKMRQQKEESKKHLVEILQAV